LRKRLLETLARGVDPLSLAVFRFLLGILFTFSALRFVSKGWVKPTYIDPSFHFRYSGLEWLPDPGPFLLYVLFGGMALGGLGIALGAFYRISAALWLGCFLWVELLEKSTYLNHYYLMTLLGILALILPLHRALSIDVRRGAVLPWSSAPFWMLFLLRFQIAVVYFFAGFAKINPDWLLRGEPMFTWLRGIDDLPLLGSLFVFPLTAIVMSWAGALYDLTIPLWLCLKRTRALAFSTVVVFHTVTWMLFPIGVFPWLMILSATLFFDPSWARKGLKLREQPNTEARNPTPMSPSASALAFLVFWCVLQIVIPLRYLAYPGDVNWNEQGFRFAWRVMLTEKTGLVEYRVVDTKNERDWLVSPRHELSPMQYKMMSTQPDMIEDYARHIATRYSNQGLNVEVYADSWVSWNGRPTRPAVDPLRELGQLSAP
jgi:hypothetical protein